MATATRNRKRSPSRKSGGSRSKSSSSSSALDRAEQARDEIAKRDDVASLRTPVGLAGRGGAQGGVVDNMSRRSDADALEGHFVSIDLNNAEAREAVKQVLDPTGDLGVEPGFGRGDYGVYIEAAASDPDTGYPITAIVRLRDSSNARVTVPFEALSPAEAGRR